MMHALTSIGGRLSGRRVTHEECQALLDAVPAFTSLGLLPLMQQYRLCGTLFLVEVHQTLDRSRVLLHWLSPNEMRDECLSAYPGIVATAFGYLPFGGDESGGGDPYFLRADSPMVFRIRHDLVDVDMAELKPGAIEPVLPSLASLFSEAQLI